MTKSIQLHTSNPDVLKTIKVGDVVFMSGQEWYDKFEKEVSTYDWSFDEKNSILVAAKKAAGIE